MNQPSFTQSDDQAAFLSAIGDASALMGAGRFQEAIDLLMAMPDAVRRHPVACNTLAFLMLHTDQAKEAVTWFEAAMSANPGDPQAIKGLGQACHANGELSRALSCYDILLASVKADQIDVTYKRSLLLIDIGKLDEALENLDKVIALDAAHVAAHSKRSEILQTRGDLQGAILAAHQSCKAKPGDASGWIRLGTLLQKGNQNGQAIIAYDRGLKIAPNDFSGLYNKALALRDLGKPKDALYFAQKALMVDGEDREVLLLCGSLEQNLGNIEAAKACFRQVAAMGAARHYPAVPQPAKFRAMMLFSPVGGNTPYEDLIKDSGFDSDVYVILPGYHHDPAALEAKGDIVVNLVSEPDRGMDTIDASRELVDQLCLPVINHPTLIAGTNRETVARLLADVPNAVMPVTDLVTPVDLIAAIDAGDVPALPVIVRQSGFHGGERMELVSEADALVAFARDAGEHALYLTRYVDYSSTDGHFRKYRFIFVNDEILPYHLAIGDVWKVHHASTRMGELEWMRCEEDVFLNHPEQVFGAPQMAALDEIRRRVGLDYFGIDCSLDRDGNVVIFEVNATMLIHLHNEGFEYKDPHVYRIKRAFEAMLEARVRKNGA
jgi:tetratricopeptide (TPR) repeat protein